MPCPQCQRENREGAKFCNECGAKLEAACPQCAHQNPPGSRFCDECGARLGQPLPTPATASAGQRAPDTYTPKHLAERILTSRAALQDERKQVTILFADLKSSTALLADRDPEEAQRLLDPVLERMMEAVHHYEGTVNQVLGDGIMALFGAPLAHEDHAVRACYAALRMQESVKQYAEEVRRTEGVLIQIRVGLNSGEVVVRSIGSDLRMDYTAVGQRTNLAARMEQLAAPGSILLPPETLQLVEGYVEVRSLGPMQAKGLSEPVEVYELVGVGTARSRLQAAAARGLTRFVGRDAELETLRRTLEQAGSGHGQLVALVGEPGVGKSRLVWEFSHSHRMQGWLVLASGSVSYGKATSYLPVIDLLKGYCRIETRDDTRCIREKLTGKLLTLDRALEPHLPAFLALLDVPTDDPAWEKLDPPQRRHRTLDAIKRLLLRESQEQPLLLVFEDLHWTDSESQALLDSLVDSLPTARILLLVNYRPEYEHAWHRKTYYQQLRLDPLPPASAEALLNALLGADGSLSSLRRPLIARTEGNPFFLEESVQSLVEARVLAGERGAYVLAKPFESTQVPATVQAVLAARIDRLVPDDKRLLQAAAVIGKDVPYLLLQAIAELPDDALRQGLVRLQAAEFLYEMSLFPELEYTFKHALTHEVAYGSLLHERRRALHARIVDAIEQLYPDRQAEQVERLAHHALRGEAWDKATAYLRQAGLKATARSAPLEAAAYFEQALEALQHLPLNRATRELAIDLRIELRPSLFSLGRVESAIDHLNAAAALAEELDDPRRVGRVSGAVSACLWWTGSYDRAVAAGQRARTIAEQCDDFGLRILANQRLGYVHSDLGDYQRAVDFLRENVAGLAGDLLRQQFGATGFPSANARSHAAWCLAELGDFATAEVLGTEGLQLAEAMDQPFSISQACWCLGRCYVRQGAIDRAIPLLERSVELCRVWVIEALRAFIVAELGYAYALSGRVAAALPLLQEAVEHAINSRFMVQQALRLAYLAEGTLLTGGIAEARDLAERALEMSRQHKERGNEAWALRLLAEIAAYTDPPEVEQAGSYYRQALALAEELGMRPLVAHCHLGLGTLYQKIGREEKAHGELATAVEMYRAMEMTFWLERAEALLAQVAN